ncbi:MAG: hypothetical protein EPO30_03440 [Lysobacteraceae bacterium]|nr:MAG: hypothetical protein EPO30_03440 [Xanthomonadaceae bacterium]
MTRKHLTLTVALLSGLGLATPAFAQTAEQQKAQIEAEAAADAATEATADALDAQAAAATADVVADATIDATAEVTADVARDNAEQAAVAAGMAAGAAAHAHAVADDAATGHMVTKDAAEAADQAAEVARAAGAVADSAAADAQFASRVGVAAAATPPQVVVPASPRSDRPAMVGNDNVTFTDHPGNSISPNYRVDFDAMDDNGDGVITRREGSGNPDLMREFHVVDLDDNGRLTRAEMKDWIDPMTQ